MCGEFNLTLDLHPQQGDLFPCRICFIQEGCMMSGGANMLANEITHSSPPDIIHTRALSYFLLTGGFFRGLLILYS